jgi:DNA-binding CsgD family transcriptional regulator
MATRRLHPWIGGSGGGAGGIERRGKVAGEDAAEWMHLALQELVSCVTFMTTGVLVGMRAEAIRRECVRRLGKVMVLLEGLSNQIIGTASPVGEVGENDDGHIHLTPRQIEVLAYRWDGLQPKEIAYKLHLKESTVRAHIRDAIESLGVHGCEAAMHKAHALGFLHERSRAEGSE